MASLFVGIPAERLVVWRSRGASRCPAYPLHEKGMRFELSEQFGVDPLVLLQKVAEVPSGVEEGMELGENDRCDEHGRRQGRGVACGVKLTIRTRPRLKPSQEPHPSHRERVGADHPATLDSCTPPAPPRANPSARWHRGALFSGPGARGRPPREAASNRLLRPFLSTALFDPPLRSFFSYSEGRRSVVKEKKRNREKRRDAVLGAFLSVAAIPTPFVVNKTVQHVINGL